MSQQSSVPIPTSEINHSFILRMTCDGSTGNWRILLKPVNDEDSRLFSDLESTFLHLEMWMIKQIQQMNRELHSEVHSENQQSEER